MEPVPDTLPFTVPPPPPLPDTAAIIARAAGVMGTNRDYLEQMARQLAALEIHDDYVAQLVSKVREIHGG